MSTERPVVKYAPQSNEPGWLPGSVALLSAVIVKMNPDASADLDVAGPAGTYRVTSAPQAASAVPGAYTLPAGKGKSVITPVSAPAAAVTAEEDDEP